MARYTSKQTTITFEDGAAVSITVGPGPGDFQVGPLEEDNSEALEARNRGTHDGLIEGDDLVQDWSITIELENQTIVDSSNARLVDWILNQTKGATALTSIDSNKWSWKCVITMNDGTVTSTITLPKVRCQIAPAQEAKEGWTLALSGRNFLAPTFVTS